MLVDFFYTLRAGGLKPSVTEFLTLLEAMSHRMALGSVEEFYYLARASLVKDETQLDRFDRIFGAYFEGVQAAELLPEGEIPEEWLRSQLELTLTEEEKAEVERLGGWEALMETLRKRLEEQTDPHHGGNKWIGTGGRSPFGAYGYNPEGIRIGQKGSRNRRAVKVWDKREFRNLDDQHQLNTRDMKMALRKLRRFAREGAAEELDLDDTIRSTARNAGYLDLRMVPERHNAAKVLLFLDVGGSMDDHVRVCEQLFSAARSEFKHLEHYYFHNCVYESVWRDNRRRRSETTPTWDVLHTYGHDYRLIFVGDASMSPYEIVQPGGSVEHNNPEPGATWLQRLLEQFPKSVWLNPQPERAWGYFPSIGMIQRLMGDRMYPLTLAGLDEAMAALRK